MNSEQVKIRLHNAIPKQITLAFRNIHKHDLGWEDAQTRRLHSVRKGYWSMLADRVDGGIPCIVVACDEGDYVVQVLSVPGKAGSFVEAIVRQADALFPFFHEKVGMLNLAGPNEAIEDLGENFGKGHYNIYINPEQHALICQPKAKE